MIRKFFNGFIILGIVSLVVAIGITEGVPLYEKNGNWIFLPIPVILLSYLIGSKVDIIKYMTDKDG